MNEFGKQLGMDDEGYIKECKAALTSSGGMPGIVYSVENGSFVWKQILDEDTGIKVKRGAVPLEPKNFVETIQRMMSVSLESNKTLADRLANCELEKLEAVNSKYV